MSVENGWLPRLEPGKPVYQAIADAIAADIRSGALGAGAKLPPLRLLAEQLGLDFTTVSRAYGEAQRRGLVVGRVGQGTFVQARGAETPRAEPAEGGLVDMAMNAPPPPADATLLARLRQDMAEQMLAFPERRLMGYGDNAGTEEDRAAGLRWLSGRLPGLGAERLLVCPGAQGALLALVTSLAAAGDTILTEELTYPGLRALAGQVGVRLVGVAMDGDGLLPDSFRAACRAHAPKALYINPTLHNPTTVTLGADRRAEIVDIARQHGVAIIEDDAYGMLPENGPPPLAAFGPDVVHYVAGLAKCLSPALRVGYLVAPDRRQALRLTGALRATSLAAAPLTAAVATRWITSGLADELRDGIRAEARLRQRVAAEMLPPGSYRSDPDAFHLWLTLPEDWARADFVGQLRARRLLVAAADAFAVGDHVPQAVRLCLGALADGAETRRALALVADLLDQSPTMTLSVV